MSYPGEVANITGSVKLDYSKFTNVSSDIAAKLQTSTAKEKVLQYNLAEAGITELGQISRRGYLISAGITPQTELYVDSRRMQLSRWPNDGGQEPPELSAAVQEVRRACLRALYTR